LIDLPVANDQHIPPILKEEKPTFKPIYNQGELFVEPKEIEQSLALEANCRNFPGDRSVIERVQWSCA